MQDLEVILGQFFQPAGQLTFYLLKTSQPNKGIVIGSDQEVASQQIMPELATEFNISQKFLLCGAVV